MALLNRFSKLNDRGETGIFTFIVTKSVTRDFHRDATTKDFCFGYHRWAISFQRPTEKVLGVHLLLRNASPNTACVVDFTLTLLNREHFSQNQVYSKKQAKFTITNPMQGVSRWIQMADLVERRFSNETGEFLFELSLSNMTTIFECDIQLNPGTLNQYKSMLARGQTSSDSATPTTRQQRSQSRDNQLNSGQQQQNSKSSSSGRGSGGGGGGSTDQLINLETNCFTFGAFDWSLTIVPLFVSSVSGGAAAANGGGSPTSLSDSSCKPTSASNGSSNNRSNSVEPVCRVYLNRLTGFDTLCRVKYRVILGHHQAGVGAQSIEFVDSKTLDQISDTDGRIRGYQFRNTNILKLVSVRSAHNTSSASHQNLINATSPPSSISGGGGGKHHHHHHHHQRNQGHSQQNHHNFQQSSASVDLRVHIEMFCANSISEAKVALHRKPNEIQSSNCSDRNKQAWCVESDDESGDTIRLKLFFLDLQSVPRNHIRYISWIAYLVRRDPKSGLMRDSIAVKNSPHSNYYLQDGIDMGIIMETDVKVRELNESPQSYLDGNMLIVHIEWIDSLLLFSHLYNNYDALATVQRHQISRELEALYEELEYIEAKHDATCKTLDRLLNTSNTGKQGGEETNEPAEISDRQTADSTDSYEIVDNSHHRRSSASNNGDNHNNHLDGRQYNNGRLQLEQQRHLNRSSPQPGRQQKHSVSAYTPDASNQWPAYPNQHQPIQSHAIIKEQQLQSAKGSKASNAEQVAASSSTTISLLSTINSAANTTGGSSGYQSKPASPIMSYEERFKLSASTPPFSSSGSSSSSSNQHHHHQHHNSHHHNHHQQQQHQHGRRYSRGPDQQMIDGINRSSSLASNKLIETSTTKLVTCQKSIDFIQQNPHLSMSPSIRRRLPQQPSGQQLYSSKEPSGGGGKNHHHQHQVSSLDQFEDRADPQLASIYRAERQFQLQHQASWVPPSVIGNAELPADSSIGYQQPSVGSRGSLELEQMEKPIGSSSSPLLIDNNNNNDNGEKDSLLYFNNNNSRQQHHQQQQLGSRNWLNPAAGGYKTPGQQVSMDLVSGQSLCVGAKSISSISFDATADGGGGGPQASSNHNLRRNQQQQRTLNDLDFAYNTDSSSDNNNSNNNGKRQFDSNSLLYQSQQHRSSLNRSIDQATFVSYNKNNNTNNRQQSVGAASLALPMDPMTPAQHHHHQAPSASHLLFGQVESGGETSVIFDPIESSASPSSAVQQINRNAPTRFSQRTTKEEIKQQQQQHFDMAAADRLMWTRMMPADAAQTATAVPTNNNLTVGAIEQMNSTTPAQLKQLHLNELVDERLPIGLFPTNIDTTRGNEAATAMTTPATNLHRRMEYMASNHSLDDQDDEEDADADDEQQQHHRDNEDEAANNVRGEQRAAAATPIECPSLLGASQLAGQLALSSLDNELARNDYQSSVRHSG